MIRRAFWLSVGAAAGITTYRRVSTVGRAISVRVTGDRSAAGPGPFWPPPVPQPGEGPRPGRPPRPVQPRPVQPRPARPRPQAQWSQAQWSQAQWSTVRAAWRTSRAAWRTQKAAIYQVRAVGRFARDVREGMDMYMNRHDEPPGSTLAGTARTAPAPRATAITVPRATAPNGRPRGRTDHVKDGH